MGIFTKDFKLQISATIYLRLNVFGIKQPSSRAFSGEKKQDFNYLNFIKFIKSNDFTGSMIQEKPVNSVNQKNPGLYCKQPAEPWFYIVSNQQNPGLYCKQPAEPWFHIVRNQQNPGLYCKQPAETWFYIVSYQQKPGFIL